MKIGGGAMDDPRINGAYFVQGPRLEGDLEGACLLAVAAPLPALPHHIYVICTLI